jgi:hypothetical protein
VDVPHVDELVVMDHTSLRPVALAVLPADQTVSA